MTVIILLATMIMAVAYAQPKSQVYLPQPVHIGALGPLASGGHGHHYEYVPVVPVVKPVAYTTTVVQPPKPVAVEPKLLTTSSSGSSAALMEKEEENYPPQPFTYSFDTMDEFGTQMVRQESGDGAGAVRGSYSYRDANGLARIVNYIADINGFRAEIQTNEPGTETSNPADAAIISSNPPVHKQL